MDFRPLKSWFLAPNPLEAKMWISGAFSWIWCKKAGFQSGLKSQFSAIPIAHGRPWWNPWKITLKSRFLLKLHFLLKSSHGEGPVFHFCILWATILLSVLQFCLPLGYYSALGLFSAGKSTFLFEVIMFGKMWIKCENSSPNYQETTLAFPKASPQSQFTEPPLKLNFSNKKAVGQTI